MFTMVLNFPNIHSKPSERPRKCPYCSSAILQKWGRTSKPLKDMVHHQAEVHRYRCTDCNRTFRTYPPGIERSTRSNRMRALAAFTWTLGLSLDSVVDIFNQIGLQMSRTTIWRDGKNFRPQQRNHEPDRRVTVLGINHFPLPRGSNMQNLVYESGGGDGRTRNSHPKFIENDELTLILNFGPKKIILSLVDFQGPHAAREWLQTLAADFDIDIAIVLNSHPHRSYN